jgi:arylsulfatase A-like enzyme
LLLALGAVDCRNEPGRRNVALVILDTVRADFTGLRAGDGSFTPVLDRLAQEGTLFTNAWAVAPWTVPSHASIFTGTLPNVHGCSMRDFRFDTDRPALAEILRKNGYEAVAMFANPWLSDEVTGLLRGFEIREEAPFAGFLRRPEDRDGFQGGPAVISRVDDWLNRRPSDRPFFLFVSFLEPHLPYDPPPDYRAEHLRDLPPDDVVSIDTGIEFNAGLHPADSVDWARVRRLYGGDVYTADRLLSDLTALLAKHGLDENTVLIVTSDHGENLGEHERMDHQFSVHETLLKVPLVIRAPGLLAPGPREEPVMLTDLYATSLDCAGVRNATVPRHSRSLLRDQPWDDSRPRPLFAEYAGPHPTILELLRLSNPNRDAAPLARAYRTIRVGRLRLTVADDGLTELHDLTADPGQQRSIAGERPHDVAALRTILDAEIPPQGTKPAAPDTLNETTREKLRALGYVD